MSHPAATSAQSSKMGHTEPVSVCIAAHNEASSIGHLLAQLSADLENGVDEVLVCVNGCTDGTETVVNHYMCRDPRIQLILSPKGKPAAWNTLMRSARNDVRLFLDADVELATNFLPAMQQALSDHPEAAIIAARDLPARTRARRTHVLPSLASRPFGFNYVSGRAYALRLSGMPQSEHGPSEQIVEQPFVMPKDILGEDLWLEVTVGRSHIAFVPAACVYYDPGTMDDLLKSRARLNVARSQIAKMQSEKFAQWHAECISFRSPISLIYYRLGATKGPADALACIIGTAIRRIIMALYRERLGRMESMMLDEMHRDGGQAVLSGTGRLSKGSPP